MDYNLRLIDAAAGAWAFRQMEELGADRGGCLHMAEKARFYLLRGDNLPVPAALILKQEALSKGAEAAIHRLAITRGVEKTPFLLMGTAKQLQEITAKLRLQPFGLKALADQIEAALENLRIKKWEIPCHPQPLKLGGRTLIMGVLNVTPDSFSDGGKYLEPQKAIDHALALEKAGADLIDIGAASSRPGSQPISAQEELERLLPVLRGLAGRLHIPISVDSDKALVAEEALRAGANIINDIGGLQQDENMAAAAAKYRVPVIIMHQGYDKRDGLGEICAYFRRSLELARQAGIEENRLILDPGLGFGKDTQDNLEILRHFEAFQVLGRPILIAGSNKRFVGALTGSPLGGRQPGNFGWVGAAVLKGAAMVRVHEVEETRRLILLCDAIKGVENHAETEI